jgi:hypothetical protein
MPDTGSGGTGTEDEGGIGMLIDCDSCAVRGPACGDCVVSVLLGTPPTGVELDDAERQALLNLADAGLVPRLRLVPGQSGAPAEGSRRAG